MAFRTRASIDPNQHKGLVVQNGNGLGGLLIPTGRSLTSSIPIDVSIVDSSGNQIASFGGGTQYTTGTSTPSPAVGTLPVYDNGGTITAVSVSNPLPVTAAVTITGVATSANQTNGTQLTGLVAGSAAIGSITNTSFAVTQATGTNLHTVVDSGTLTAVTSITNALPAGANALGTVGTTPAVVNVGQKTVNTTAVQISVTSTVPTNGIIIQALSTNAASIFVGSSGVTSSTGFELVAGQAMSFTCNLNTLYIISAASTTDKVCYNVE